MNRSTSARNHDQTSDAGNDAQRAAVDEAVPFEAALPGPAAIAGLTDARFDLPANTPVRGSVARALQATHGNAYVQRLMGGAAPKTTPDGLPAEVSEGIESQRGGGSPLPEDVRSEMEPAFGESFDDVRVHADSAGAAVADGLSARAVASGRAVYFEAGAFQPATEDGRRLIAHELAHVAQQSASTVTAPPTEPGSPEEASADNAAERVMAGQPVGPLAPAGIGPARAEPSLSSLTSTMAKGANDPREFASPTRITSEQLALLHVDDLKALKRSTELLITSTAMPTESRGEQPPMWVETARRFLNTVLEPAIAEKLRDGEVAKLFWPLVEHVKNNCSDQPLKAAFLNVLPYVERYVSGHTGNAPAEIALTLPEQIDVGAPNSSFDDFVTKCLEEKRAIELADIAAHFVNVPKAIASKLYETVSVESTKEGLDAEEVFEGDALRDFTQARIEKLGAKLLTSLGKLSDGWNQGFVNFWGRTAGDSAPTELRELNDFLSKRGEDPTTVTSCYQVANQFGPPGYEQESPDERFQRALEAMTKERADGADPSPLSWTNPEAQLTPGKWTEVQVLYQRGDQYEVHPIGMPTEYDKIVARDDLRPKSLWSKGDQVMIEWESTLYPGEIIEIRGSQARLHWHGFADSYDADLISLERLQPLGGKGNPTGP